MRVSPSLWKIRNISYYVEWLGDKSYGHTLALEDGRL
jgi:hypothetical protein